MKFVKDIEDIEAVRSFDRGGLGFDYQTLEWEMKMHKVNFVYIRY